ncbi:MAG TPA: NYN domain-containing protein [Ktedonobacteraceae bacterium]|nr:NYN domain-containing protein [Ktedonobacteraceae bacterium]
MGRTILVDGYNVIKRSPAFQVLEAKNLALARQQLITQLVNRYRHTPHQVTVVFDGNSEIEQVQYERRIRIMYSRHGETADSVIARLATAARQEGREVEMYSDDREVQQTVARQGGNVHSTGQLTDQLHAAPRDVARRTRHRIAMRKKYGLDPMYYDGDDDEIEPVRSHGKKKRSSYRKR